MNISFEQPLWLALILLGVALGIVSAVGLAAVGRIRRVTVALARAVLVALLAMSLAGAASVRETERIAQIAVIDVSGSVERFAEFGVDDLGRPRSYEDVVREHLEAASEGRGPDDLLGIVLFDGATTVVAAPTTSGVIERDWRPARSEGTDLAGALRLAQGMLPPEAAPRIRLFSDGLATTDVESLAPRTPIDVTPIEFEARREVIVERVDAPPRAGAESTVTIRIVLRAASPATGTLRLLREGLPVDLDETATGDGRRVTLREGANVELATVRLPAGRVHRFEAVFEPDLSEDARPIADRSLENNRAASFTLTPGEGAILLVDGVSDGAPGAAGSTLARALERSGLRVEVVGSRGVPDSIVALQAYDAVILQNVPADDVEERRQRLLAEYARTLGGGIVFVGGPQAFGAGGWRGSTLEPLLPVRLDLPDRVVQPEVAIVFVLDRSGSMGQSVLGSARSQQQIAGEAAARAVRSLDKTDLVGVVSFSSTSSFDVPLAPNEDPESTGLVIRSIVSGGGTDMGPALRRAGEALDAVDAKVKHVIALTDGQSQASETLPDIASDLATRGITVSTIGVGDGADVQNLEQIAQRGGGSFYNVVNPNVLPRVFLRAVRVVRSPLLRLAPFRPVVLGVSSPYVEGVETAPSLDGLVLTRAREDESVSNALASPEGEPLLAHWPVGLGQVAAFTSDAHAWAEPWLGWPGYESFWGRLVRGIARPTRDDPGVIRASIAGGQLRVRYDARDDGGRPIDLLSVPVSVYAPDGARRDIVLSQTGPGRYEGVAPAEGTGVSIVVATPRLAGTPLPPLLTGASSPAGAEYASLASDRAALEQLAERSEGRVIELDEPLPLFDRDGVEPVRARTPLWPTLLAWSVVAFLFDVGTRRVAWDRLIGGASWSVSPLASQRAADTTSALRGRERRDEGAGALGDEDAARLAREAKRKIARAARGPADPAVARQPDRDGSGTASSESSLMAAKRRAQKRFEDQ